MPQTHTLARLAAMLCANPDFQKHVGVNSAEKAAVYVRKHCGVTSRRELDQSEAAAKRFHELRKRFAYRSFDHA
ncbi:MAG: hypothetical protein CML16_14840 [Pusillimonas sp.]|nr:hypothetical protein [Pusillimonas sp.]MBC42821.1 hypothetical protein [Pusillimonas sp.]HCP79415.1 hypothetical protein [Pusillimonas sp.]|tara:strand:- start:10610 stop:10831 length:222 start_codon:yes stop_codon:yes gene_type:complete